MTFLNSFLNKLLTPIEVRIEKLLDKKLSAISIENEKRNTDLKILIASLQTKTDLELESIQQAELKVFSQWGDDGIIQYLIKRLNIQNKTFVEFGVEDYTESNTRFLLINNNWSGLVMDGNDRFINKIRNSNIYWKYDLKAKKAFVTSGNINGLIEEEGISGEIGLLHIDIDGNDYWIWKALKVVSPIIMIVEYNSVFGFERPLTIPYRPDFQRTKAHSSNLYAGASILSLCDLAETKGYAFVGSNSAGNNAYFVKKTHLGSLKALTAKEGYIESKFREARNDIGELTLDRVEKRIERIQGMEIYNTRAQGIELI